MDREAMQMALDAFDYFFPTEDGQLWHTANDVKKIDDARQALQQALETEHDPVAWRWKERINNDFDSWVVTFSEPPPYAVEQQPLYTAPPKTKQEQVECMCGICKLGKREWVGLTDGEIHDMNGYEEDRRMYRFARAIEAKLKEKNHG